jgi:hypothetical protein
MFAPCPDTLLLLLLPLPIVLLCFAAVLGLFTVPKIYEMRKDEIDEYLGKASATMQQQVTKTRAQVSGNC